MGAAAGEVDGDLNVCHALCRPCVMKEAAVLIRSYRYFLRDALCPGLDQALHSFTQQTFIGTHYVPCLAPGPRDQQEQTCFLPSRTSLSPGEMGVNPMVHPLKLGHDLSKETVTDTSLLKTSRDKPQLSHPKVGWWWVPLPGAGVTFRCHYCTQAHLCKL